MNCLIAFIPDENIQELNYDDTAKLGPML
jgi:hypothetical protein